MRIRAKHILAIVILAIIAAAALFFSRPAAAPELRFATLDGETLVTSDLRGKVVLVDFWATSCATCVKEMPMWVETHRKFAPRGYETVAVAMSYDHPNLVAEYAQKNALPFHVALDSSGEIAKGFGGVSLTPTTIILDRRGRIVKQFLGEPDQAELHALLEKTLSDPA
jgi:peroxiredoxin